LIAHQYHVGEHLVVVFLRMLVRGSSDYNQGFLNDPKGYGDRYLAPLVDMAKIEKWLEDQISEAPPPEKQEPTEDERRYLWEVLGKEAPNGTEVLVCESEDWVRTVTDKKMRNKLVLLAEPLLEASENGTDEQCTIPVQNRSDLRIVGRYFPEHAKLFLAATVSDPSEAAVKRVRDRYSSILSAESTAVTEKLILQHSMRAYPNELLLDEDLWIDVEQDEASNLALSPEEASILESVHNLSGGTNSVGFPLFINGRAGSGKSTILQYLFADYLRLHFSMPRSESLRPPLYFSCSTDLLQRSREVVSGLLTCGHRCVLRHHHDADMGDAEREQEVLSACFREFHSFLYSYLPPEARSGGFSRSGYVDYARFKVLWHEKFGRDPKAVKSYGADVSWHVVRSYIKGLSADGYLDPEEYCEQPERERTVSEQTFEVIYKRVWKNWYGPMCEEGEYWDDQDLARRVLEDERIRPQYPAIFCDEAQDFTRLELEVLFRLSLFSERRLTPHELNRVPFAFAGDPFQTLNPTGFRWDAIKSAFVLKFLRSLDPASQSGIKDLNYQELSYNYRSTKNVVRLCNSIQAMRSVLFAIPDLKPQTTWQYESASPMPVWFEIGKGNVLDALKKETDLTIIVPCQEGEEIAYVDDDEFLSSAVQRDDTGVPQNVLSATRAKGLEFNRVVLYGFGRDCFPDLLAPLEGAESYADTPEMALPREYAVNRLYVAASRPKRRLFVIDSIEGMHRLWRFATDAETQEAILVQVRHDSGVWRENIGMLQPGVAESWSTDREDLSEVAARYEREGRSNRDYYMLRSAAMSYQNVGDQLKARQCLAFALLYEQQYKKAGDTFADCEDYEQALAAYWEGSEYEAITRLGKTTPEVCTGLEYRLSSFFTKSPSAKAGMDLLTMIEEKLSDSAFQDSVLPSQAWGSAIRRIFEDLLRAKLPDAQPRAWLNISQSAERLSHLGFSVSPSSLGMLFYRAEEWGPAVSYWSAAKDTQTDEFRDASARALLAEIESGRKSKATSDEAAVLAEFYTRTKQCSLAARYWAQVDDEKGLARACSLALEIGDRASALDAVKSVIEMAVRHGRWSQLLTLWEDGKWGLIHGEGKKALQQILREEGDAIDATATLLLAQSDLLPAADGSQQKRVSDLLKRLYVQDMSSWVRHTTPDVAGAAIERAGRVIDALQFWENVMAAPVFTIEQKQRAQRRWIKAKFRQADREERANRAQLARRHAGEAEEKVRAWGIADAYALPEYAAVRGFTQPVALPLSRHALQVSSKEPSTPPSLEADKPKEEPTSRAPVKPPPKPLDSHHLVWSVGELTFRYSKEARRINVEHRKTLETATIHLGEGRCTSSDVEFVSEGGNQGVFICRRWDLACDVSRLHDGHVGIRFPGERFEVLLQVGE